MRKSFAALLFAGALTSLVACNDDLANNAGNNEAISQATGYVAFSIRTDLSTRAEFGEEEGDVTVTNPADRDEVFNPGTADEYALASNAKAHWAIFFDKQQNFFGASNLEGYTVEDSNYPGHPEHDNGYPEQVIAKYAKAAESTSELDYPSYALVLLNIDPTKAAQINAQLGGKSVNDALKMIAAPVTADEKASTEKVGQYEFDGQTYFTMTNSAFYNAAGAPQLVTTLGIDKVYETPQEAYQHRSTVYVERIVAKHSLTFENGQESGTGYIINPAVTNKENYFQIAYVADYDGKNFVPQATDWTVYIGAWGMNGVEPNTFLFKNLYPAAQLATPYAGWTMEQTPDFFADWNFEGLHRSYWAVDQHYLDNGLFGFNSIYNGGEVRDQYSYPNQYRNPLSFIDNPNDIFGADQNGEDRENGKTARTSLNYISYNNLLKYGNSGHRYTLENTFADQEGHKEYAPLRYGTHVILTAKVLFDGETAESAATKRSAYGYFFGNDNSYIRYAYKQMCHDALYDNAEMLYDGQPIDVAHAEDYFELVPAYSIHGDGKQIIQFKGDVSKLSYMQNDENHTFANAEAIQKEIYEHVEPVKYYTDGMMYYAVPVQHRMGHSNDPNFPVVKLGKGETYKYDLGQFGVVRNHWYVFNVTGVGNLGIPVQDPDQPIIPDPEIDYYLSFDVVIIPWHKINNDNVTLQ